MLGVNVSSALSGEVIAFRPQSACLEYPIRHLFPQ